MVSARERLAQNMVEDAERVLDYQFRVWKDLDEKIHNLVKLAIVAAVFGLAIGTFLLSAPALSSNERPFMLAGVSVVFTINLVAVYLFSHAYSSINGTRYAQCPPDIQWLVNKLRTPGMELEIHLESLLLGMEKSKNANVESMENVSKWRRRGVWTLAWLVVPGYWVSVILIAVFHVF